MSESVCEYFIHTWMIFAHGILSSRRPPLICTTLLYIAAQEFSGRLTRYMLARQKYSHMTTIVQDFTFPMNLSVLAYVNIFQSSQFLSPLCNLYNLKNHM